MRPCLAAGSRYAAVPRANHVLPVQVVPCRRATHSAKGCAAAARHGGTALLELELLPVQKAVRLPSTPTTACRPPRQPSPLSSGGLNLDSLPANTATGARRDAIRTGEGREEMQADSGGVTA